MVLDRLRAGERVEQDGEHRRQDDDDDLEAVADAQIEDQQGQERGDGNLAQKLDGRLRRAPDDGDAPHEEAERDADDRGGQIADRGDAHGIGHGGRKAAVDDLVEPHLTDLGEGRQLRHAVGRADELPQEQKRHHDGPAEGAAGEVAAGRLAHGCGREAAPVPGGGRHQLVCMIL